MNKTGLTPLGAVALLALGCMILASFGCTHVPKGGAGEVHASFGIPGVFSVEKNITGIKVTDKTIKAAETDTTIQILLFQWKSSGKDIALPNPPPTQ